MIYLDSSVAHAYLLPEDRSLTMHLDNLFAPRVAESKSYASTWNEEKVSDQRSYQMPNKVNGWEAFRDRANIDSITLMPGEDHEDFENLLRDHYEEFTPDGTTEEYLTIEIAKLRWERDRLDRSLQLEMSVRRSELMVEHELAHEFREAKSRAAEFQQTNSVEDVEKLLSQLGDMIGGLVRKWPHGSGDQPESWGSVIAKRLTALPDLEAICSGEMYLKLHNEFPVLDRVFKLERIDVLIDRTFKRLIQLKTMKQMFRQLEPKVISITQDKKRSAKS
jgi:hypothetical protein